MAIENEGIPTDWTPCEEYRGFIIALKEGSYTAFRKSDFKMSGWLNPTRAEIRDRVDIVLAMGLPS